MTVAAANQYPIAPPENVRSEQLGMSMLHGMEGVIDTDNSIYPPEAIGLASRQGDYEVSVVGEFALAVDNVNEGKWDQESSVALLKVRNAGGEVRYALQGLATDQDGNARALPLQPVGVRAHDRVVLGRSGDSVARKAGDDSLISAEQIWGPGTLFSESTSRRHLQLESSNNTLKVKDTSTNGTPFKANFVPTETHVYEHTVLASDLARERQLLNERGEFAGRKVITRNTTMGGSHPEGTVDIRSWGAGAEAIVVDAEKDPEPYAKLRDSFLKAIAKERKWSPQGLSEVGALRGIYESVTKAMKYDLEYVNRISEEMAKQGGEHRKINLSLYLHEGRGVCRQMALAAAWLGGEAVDQGLLRGRLTAEVNQNTADNSAHEWARYTSPTGEVYIIDPAQRYFGRLEDSLGKGRWNYFRPGEKQLYEQRLGGRALNVRLEADTQPEGFDPIA